MIYFKLSEFDSPDKRGSGRHMKTHVLERLDGARGNADIPFKINSGFRTKEHNDKIGGSPTSSHMGGWAVDIHCDNSSDRELIVSSLIMVGFRRIGIYKTFIHADLDPNKKPVIWLG